MSPWPEATPAATALEPYTAEERASLLAIARQSILTRLTGGRFAPRPLTARLAEPRGVFVTLYRGDVLRGCIGYPFAAEPLYRAVSQAAAGAALEDPRFPPVSTKELPEVRVSLSVLSALAPIAPSEIEIGRHGLMVSQGSARGLLLPQVAVEHDWTSETFLENACMKAGLPPDAWKCGARLEAFTAEVFGEGL
jgi:AmmeMemoRadiSam system protein A